MQWELQLKEKEAYLWVAAIKTRKSTQTECYVWLNQISDQIIIMNIISTELARAGWCSACVKGKRSVQYCWLIKEHDDEKSGSTNIPRGTCSWAFAQTVELLMLVWPSCNIWAPLPSCQSNQATFLLCWVVVDSWTGHWQWDSCRQHIGVR